MRLYHVALFFAAFSVIVLSCGIDRFTYVDPSRKAKFDLGEITFGILHNSFAAGDECPNERAAKFAEHQDDFIDAVNAMIPTDTTIDLVRNADSIYPLIDDDTIPLMADDIAAIMDQLRNDTATIDAIVALQDATPVLNAEDTIDFVAQLVNYSEFEDLLTAINNLIKENDGVDASGVPNEEKNLVDSFLELASEALLELDPNVAPGANNNIRRLYDALLKEATFTTAPSFGQPSWAVRVDTNTNPKVAIDSNTSTLMAPFVDTDSDGVADINANGNPVDASGSEIDLPPFASAVPAGFSGLTRDSDKKLVGSGGQFVYEYYDAKLTAFSLILQLASDAMELNVHGDAINLMDAIIGTPTTQDNGTPSDPSDDFEGYGDDNPMLDMKWAQHEILRYPEAPKLLKTIAKAIEDNRRLVEELIIAAADAYDKADKAQIGVSSPGGTADMNKLIDDLLPIVDRVFDTQVTGGGTQPQSIGRVLMKRIADFHVPDPYYPGPDPNKPLTIAENLPNQLEVMCRYSSAVGETVADNDPNDLDEALSTPVDFTMPPTYTGTGGGTVDNRSIQQQLLDLLAFADNCPPILFGVFGGNTLAEDVLIITATSTPTTVKNMVGVLLGPLGVVLGPVVNTLLCAGIYPHLTALDGLAKSGALNAYISITQVFHNAGQIRLLADLLKTLQSNYDPTLRQNEPSMADYLGSGSLERIFEVVKKMTEIDVPGTTTGEKMADIVADSAANLVDDDKTPAVTDRLGNTVNSLVYLLLNPMREIDTRIKNAGADAISDRLGDNIFNLVVDTETNDNGTPADTTDDFEELKNDTIIPLLAEVLRYAADTLSDDQATRDADVTKWQNEASDFYKGKKFADLWNIALILDKSPSKAILERALINMLTPNTNPSQDIFGSYLKLFVSILEKKSNADERAENQIANFVGRMLKPGSHFVEHIVDGLVSILGRDAGQTILFIVRNGVDRTIFSTSSSFADSPLAQTNKAPIEVLSDILTEVFDTGCAAHPAAGGNFTADELRQTLGDAIEFINDDVDGLKAIFNDIKNRDGGGGLLG
ncbi:MAG: hypothetical protein NUW37_15795 [Planctomycetes bacterium]|nr:hypothetical protein [Planctomycetota bacterium]